MPPLTVTIIGAGPTGLSAALALADRGCRVRILERNAATTRESRAVGVNRRSLLLLETVGASAPILEVAAPLERVRLFSGGARLATLTLPRAGDGAAAAVALPQSATEAILVAELAKRGLQVDWETEATAVAQTPDEATVTARGPGGTVALASDYVLGAEGSRSVTRKALGLEFAGHAYPDHWTLFDAVLDWPWPDTQAAAFLDAPGHAMLAITLGDGRHRVIGNYGDLEQRIGRIIPVREVSWRNQFALSERRVNGYGRGRIWIAGDAAHVHSPVGGMGMNLGIDDAFDFAASVTAGDLQGYQRRRLAAAARVMRIADRGLRLVTSRNRAVRLLRDLGIRVLGASPALQRRLGALMFAADLERAAVPAPPERSGGRAAASPKNGP